MIGDPNATPFIWFAAGTPVFPVNNVRESLIAVAGMLTNDPSGASLSEIIQYQSVAGQRAPTLDRTWYAYFRDVVFDERLATERALRVNFLTRLAIPPLRRGCEVAKRLLIEEIDAASGWSRSWRKDDPFMNSIRRMEDGTYVHDTNGRVARIIGVKTTAETRNDYIADSVLRPFGEIRYLLDVMSVVAVSADFAGNSQSYPRSMRLMVWSPEWGPAAPRWHLSQGYQARTAKWRPANNLCDSDWLAHQVLAEVMDGTNAAPWEKRFEVSPESSPRLEGPFQLDYVIDTGLLIGDAPVVWLEFEGRRFRWTNNSPESQAVVSIGLPDINDRDDDVLAINRLLTALAWQNRTALRKEFGAATMNVGRPVAWGPRRPGYLNVSTDLCLPDPTPWTGRQWTALSHFRQGLSAQSQFDAFLSFWRILELGVPDKADRGVWIDAAIGRIAGGTEWGVTIAATGETASKYLRDACRNALAHVYHKRSIDPDDPGDARRIAGDAAIMRKLAERMINTGMFV